MLCVCIVREYTYERRRFLRATKRTGTSVGVKYFENIHWVVKYNLYRYKSCIRPYNNNNDNNVTVYLNIFFYFIRLTQIYNGRSLKSLQRNFKYRTQCTYSYVIHVKKKKKKVAYFVQYFCEEKKIIILFFPLLIKTSSWSAVIRKWTSTLGRVILTVRYCWKKNLEEIIKKNVC